MRTAEGNNYLNANRISHILDAKATKIYKMSSVKVESENSKCCPIARIIC